MPAVFLLTFLSGNEDGLAVAAIHQHRWQFFTGILNLRNIMTMHRLESVDEDCIK